MSVYIIFNMPHGHNILQDLISALVLKKNLCRISILDIHYDLSNVLNLVLHVVVFQTNIISLKMCNACEGSNILWAAVAQRLNAGFSFEEARV